MIRGEHVRQEIKKAGEVVKSVTDDNAVVKLAKVAIKLLTVVAKIGLSLRTNQKLIMDKLGVEPVKPTVKEEEKETPHQAE